MDIIISKDGSEVDVREPGHFEILYHSFSLVEAIEWCESRGIEYKLIWLGEAK